MSATCSLVCMNGNIVCLRPGGSDYANKRTKNKHKDLAQTTAGGGDSFYAVLSSSSSSASVDSSASIESS